MEFNFDKILEAIEFADDSSEAFLDMDTGEIIWVGEYMDVDEDVYDRIDLGNFEKLPTQYDINEYGIMEDFIDSLPDGEISNKLANAIRGRGAFRRFKDTVNYLGIADKWYTFRDNALKETAIQWCREKGLIPEPVNEAGYPDRPYVICHMVTSIDGKVTGDFLLHEKCKNAEDVYYQLNREYAADAFACGRVTMEGSFTQGYEPDLSNHKGERIKREDHIADTTADYYAVSFDRMGRLGWKDARIYDDDPGYSDAHIIEVLCEDVPDENLLYFREKGISYIFAGKDEIDIGIALKKLRELFGIKKLMLEGGSIINGAFAKEKLIDELSLVVAPIVADRESKPLFDKTVLESYRLKQVKDYGNSVLWLNYANTNL